MKFKRSLALLALGGVFLIGSSLPASSGAAPAAARPRVTVKLPDLVPSAGSLRDYFVDRVGNRAYLRFSGGIANIGDGPLRLKGRVKKPSSTIPAFEVISRRGAPPLKVSIGSFEYDPVRVKWHVFYLAEYRLLDASGNPVANSSKQSVCLVDTLHAFPNLPGSPASRRFGTCPSGAKRRSIQVGVSVGWADIYAAEFAGQSLDITNVPPGVYTLEMTVNPDPRCQEKTRANNVLSIPVAL